LIVIVGNSLGFGALMVFCDPKSLVPCRRIMPSSTSSPTARGDSLIVIVGNSLGFGALMVFCMVVFSVHGLSFLLRLPCHIIDPLCCFLTSAGLGLLDLWMRGAGAKDPPSYVLSCVLPWRGGHLFFVPTWVIALVVSLGTLGYVEQSQRLRTALAAPAKAPPATTGKGAGVTPATSGPVLPTQ
jgi:hypothetical protein